MRIVAGTSGKCEKIVRIIARFSRKFRDSGCRFWKIAGKSCGKFREFAGKNCGELLEVSGFVF